MEQNQTQVQKATPKKTVEALLNSDHFKNAVAMSLPKHCKPDRFIRVALSAFNRTPKLRNCTQESLFNCFLRLSELGIEADGRRAHLIPYGDQCTLIVDYKGLAELIMRSGEVSFLYADIVCEHDDFAFDKGQITRHKIDFRQPRGAMYAAYALARLKHEGEEVARVLSKEDIDAVRKRSRAANAGPWVTDYAEMAKKTAFRNLSKWLPLSPELREAVEKDDDAIEIQGAKVVSVSQSFLTAPTPTPAATADPEPETPSQDEAAEAAQGLAPETPKVNPASTPQTPPPTAPPAKPATPGTLPVISGAVTVFQRFNDEILTAENISFDDFLAWANSRGLLANRDPSTIASIEEIDGRTVRALLGSGKAAMLAEIRQGGLL